MSRMGRSIPAFCKGRAVPGQHLPVVCFTSAGPEGPQQSQVWERGEGSLLSHSSSLHDDSGSPELKARNKSPKSSHIKSPPGLLKKPPALNTCQGSKKQEIKTQAQPDFAAPQRGSIPRSGNLSGGAGRAHTPLDSNLHAWPLPTHRFTMEDRGKEGR